MQKQHAPLTVNDGASLAPASQSGVRRPERRGTIMHPADGSITGSCFYGGLAHAGMCAGGAG